MGKTGRKNKTYSPEFKISAILDMREHRMGYRETARKYDLVRQSEAAAASMLHRWERIYLEEGAEGLMKERRGKACSAVYHANPHKYLRGGKNAGLFFVPSIAPYTFYLHTNTLYSE